ncbi:unnamed protein product [Penicillium nalgiovense]|uniref:DUF1996 domain-containing protein n=1 Tax=Penicillium nalgiovense TaxID=60175 RepID=A0A1V6YYK6_PENNA|nr:hypothetical protein PENNAL_c0007G00868 [Penicillium nalgiovense]CAG8025670.1 unnamed protein product [Penicillium nalgiovense]CAG8031471.1 unnamed protein product [Penicillium nalgiovense]CAG8037628.1 unnamed protein product [Penicillium nalgiovense]CAG8107211.1 unnamed protein product [Penicillium nalgiovense]
MQDLKLTAVVMACFALFPSYTNAFWRLPCRGRSGLARLDPIVEPGEISGHAHAVHGGGNFGMSSDQSSLLSGDCTSCAVTQDKSAYWAPALYFMHTNGSAQVVDEVGGMLAYYLLYGENIKAFPDDFRMLAGDPFLRNFSWPVPDPPKSMWNGDQASQAALRQKAIGFNCLNYKSAAEDSLHRHFMPDKAFLDKHCTDGVRIELMFPSCWNGKDADSPDHKSHVAYPSLVMDGTCPEGFETRLVSLFYETIWDTYAFKDYDGYFALANGDPTGFGYHGDFMQAWDSGVLQEAIDTCTSESGVIDECKVFDIQTENEQRQCQFPIPSEIKDENCEMHHGGLPGGMPVEWGPEPASMKPKPKPKPATTTSDNVISLPTISLGGISIDPNTLIPSIPISSIPETSVDPNSLVRATSTAEAATSTAEATSTPTSIPTSILTSTSTSTSTPSPTPTPVTSTVVDPFTEEIIYLERDVVVLCDGKGNNYSTSSGAVRTVSTTRSTIMETSTAVSYVKKDTVPEPVEPVQAAGHARRHLHHRHGRTHN